MTKIIKYTDAFKLTNDTWESAPKKKKEELLQTLGYDKSFAKAGTVKEMVARGGGSPANALLGLNRTFLERKGGVVYIRYKRN
jgi:hypothetical protein